MALPCVNPNLADFVDRKEELELLIEKIKFSTNQNIGKKPLAHERVVHLIGKSDVGKSLLLCKYHNHIFNRENTQSVILDFENYLGFSGDQFAVQVLNFIYSHIALFLRIQPPNTIVMSAQEVSTTVLRDLEILQRTNKVVFLMDEVSMLSGGQIEVLEDCFLARCLSFPNTVLILTGRQTVTGWKEFALRPLQSKTEKGNVLELTGFDLDKTREQIKTVKPSADDLAHKIHEISGGSPGKNKIILDQIISDPPQIVELDALRACNQELYDALDVVKQGLPDNLQVELLPALEALCVLQDFDKEYEMPVLLAAHTNLNGVWDVNRSVLLLNVLSGIQVGPGRLVDWDKNKSAYAIEEQTRFNLEQELKIRNPDLWKSLHSIALIMYTEWAGEYGSDIFTAKSEYHKSQIT